MSSSKPVDAAYLPEVSKRGNSTNGSSPQDNATETHSKKMDVPLPLASSEATLRALIENTKEAFILFDTEGLVLTFNQVAARLYRKHNNREIKTGVPIYGLVSPERHELTKEIFQKVLTGETVERTVRHTSADGETYHF